MMLRLLTIHEAAAELGVPKGSLETAAAEQHGFLVCMGRARPYRSRIPTGAD